MAPPQTLLSWIEVDAPQSSGMLTTGAADEALGGRFWTTQLLGLIAGFAFGMLLMEVMLEALFSLEDVPRTIALWNSTCSFFCCAALPTAIAFVQRRRSNGPGGNGTSCEDVVGDEGSSLTQESPPGSMATDGLVLQLHHWRLYIILSALQFLSSFAANYAVHFVDFTVKVVFKASKLLPTMAVSSLVGNARAFTGEEYLSAVLLCCGTAMFSQGSAKGDRHGGESRDSNLQVGALLLALACLIEAGVPNAQQRLMKEGVSANNLMMRMNVFGAVGGAVGLLLSGDVPQMLAFFRLRPEAPLLLLGAGLAFSVSIACSTRIIQAAGSVFAAAVSTLRKTATVFLSFVLFPGKHFGAVRALGIVAVLAGMVLAEHASLRPASASATAQSGARRWKLLAGLFGGGRGASSPPKCVV